MAENKKEWSPTEEQRRAIETRDRTLLVSAAAGSGKTATLTNRIIASLLDEEAPENINEILIVTFTRAAVAELRERIGKAIREAIRKNPENARLRRQLALLPSAKIQTIDSFCVDILRKNCDRVGVSPLFRIPDSAETLLLAKMMMERLIDGVFEGLMPEVATPEELEALTDGLTSSKQMNELAEVFLALRGKVNSSELGVDGLSELIKEYSARTEEELAASRPISYAMGRVRDMAAHYRHFLERALLEFDPTYSRYDDYCAMCSADIAFTESLERAESYGAMRSLLFGNMQAAKARRDKKVNEAMLLSVSLREQLDADVKRFREEMFFLPSEELLSLYERLRGQLSVLCRFMSRFERDFREEKRRLAICDFDDIKRYTYESLYDGAPTETARAEAARYSSIYIDEYQDVDALQNRIFEAISRADNRFMVGDIKQSIYVFRGAKPEIFAEMKRSFTDLDKSVAGEAATLFMSKNFRSERPVIDFVNEIFDKLFGLAGESIGYRYEDRLLLGRAEREGLPCPEVHVLPKLSASKDAEEEPRFVAARIKELLESGRRADGKEIKPSDIAILLRNDRGRSAEFARALDDIGVSAFISETKSFFMCEEVLLALCLLNSIDNPRKDIYLAGLMCSPLFGFTVDDLMRIKRTERDETLYGSLVGYCRRNPDYTHGAELIATLKKYRRISEGLSVDEIISRLYRETGLLALASEEGKRNLNLFYEHARSFEASSFKGLYNFIKYINDVIESGGSLDEKKEASDSQAVKIVTAHSSKGLEYPVVFFVDAASKLGKRDSGRLMYADGFALSMTLRSASGLSVLDNPINNIISDYKLREELEGELRVLYVALTRAKERLCVVGTSPNVDADDFVKSVELRRETLTPYGVYGISSFLEAVLATVSSSAKVTWHDSPEPESSEEERRCASVEVEASEEIETLADEIFSRFAFEYPDLELTTLPEKMAVSYLYPTVLDGTEETPIYELLEGAGGRVTGKPARGVLPLFMSETDPGDSAKRGIATHLFMQFCDLEYFAENGARAELDRLVREKFISPADAERVRLDEVELFHSSRLFSEMRGAKKLYRELRFNLKFPASRFTRDPERRSAFADKTVLVQGVIDCIVEREDGELLLVDYKTDRLTEAELKDKALAVEKLTRSHASQLSYYKIAVEKMFGKAPASVSVYSLPLGDTVEIKIDKM